MPTWTDVEDEARPRSVDGTVVAAVLVDLRETQDVVLVNARADGELNDAVVDRIAVDLASQRPDRRRSRRCPGRRGRAAGRVRWFVLLSALLGFGFVLGISLARGPVAGAGPARPAAGWSDWAWSRWPAPSLLQAGPVRRGCPATTSP